MTPQGRFVPSQTYQDHALGRQKKISPARKEVHDPQGKTWNIWTKHWAAGFLLDCGVPAALFGSFRVQEDPVAASLEAFEKLTGYMAERWSRKSYGARVAHLERAKRVLDMADA